MKLIDGTTVQISDRRTIEHLWLTNRVTLTEAASTLTNLLHLHSSNAPRIWYYLENLKRSPS